MSERIDATFDPKPDFESPTQADNVIRGRFPDKLPEFEPETSIKLKHVLAAGAVLMGALMVREILDK
jgi:hypothetical protein